MIFFTIMLFCISITVSCSTSANCIIEKKYNDFNKEIIAEYNLDVLPLVMNKYPDLKIIEFTGFVNNDISIIIYQGSYIHDKPIYWVDIKKGEIQHKIVVEEWYADTLCIHIVPHIANTNGNIKVILK